MISTQNDRNKLQTPASVILSLALLANLTSTGALAKATSIRSDRFVLTASGDNQANQRLVVKDDRGRVVFDSMSVSAQIAKSAFADAQMDERRQRTADRNNPDVKRATSVQIEESFELKSFVGPYLSLKQSQTITDRDKDDMPLGAHPTEASRIIAIDLRNPENIALRSITGNGDKSYSPNELQLTALFSPNLLKQAILQSDDSEMCLAESKQKANSRTLDDLIVQIQNRWFGKKHVGLLNRFYFDSSSISKAGLVLAIEQGGASASEPSTWSLSITAPEALRKQLTAAANRKSGILANDVQSDDFTGYFSQTFKYR